MDDHENNNKVVIHAEVHNYNNSMVINWNHHSLWKNHVPYWSMEEFQKNTKQSDSNNLLASTYLEVDDNQSSTSVDTFCSKIDIENDSPNNALDKLDSIIRNAENYVDDDEDGADSQISCSKSSGTIKSTKMCQLEINSVQSKTKVKKDKQDIAKTVNHNFFRKVERFGTNINDLCIFTLALPMDGSDIYRKKSTWESINLLADCVLRLWTEQIDKKSSNLIGSISNNVFRDPIKYLCLRPELVDYKQFEPINSLPLRKYYSLIDLKMEQEISSNMIDKSIIKRSFSNNMFTTSLISLADSELILENFIKASDTEVKQLAFMQKLQDPKRFALKLSKLEKKNFLKITWREIMNVMCGKITCNNINLKKMILFGQEVSYLVASLVCIETSIEGQKQTIATIIEVAFFLFMKKNFQSFESIMRGLQLPQVYVLEESWKSLWKNSPLHFKIYSYLSSLIIYNSKTSVIYSPKSSLPTLSSFIELLRVKSLSILNRPKETNGWKNEKHIFDVMTRCYFKETLIKQKIEAQAFEEFKKKMRLMKRNKKQFKISFRKLFKQQKQEDGFACNLTMMKKESNKVDENSIRGLKILNRNCFLTNELPDAWALISPRHLSSSDHRILIKEFVTFFREVMNQIKSYKF